jgi:hypothetical protein
MSMIRGTAAVPATKPGCPGSGGRGVGSGVGPADSTGLGDSLGEAVAADVAGAEVKAGVDDSGIDAVDCAEDEGEPPAAGFDDA